MKTNKILIIAFISVFFFSPLVKAEVCSTSELAKAKKNAQDVTASYEIKMDTTGNYYVDISIYNFTDKFYVAYKYSSSTDTNEIHYKEMDGKIYFINLNNDNMIESSDGVYHIYDYDNDIIKKYSITVYDNQYNCITKLKTISLTKPKKNSIADNSVCSYSEVSDSYYCNEWITEKFVYSDDYIINKLIDKHNKVLYDKIENNQDVDISYVEYLKQLDKKIYIIALVVIIAIIIDTIIIISNLIHLIRKDDIL